MTALPADEQIFGVKTGRSAFYMWMAAVFILIAFGGFTPTFWAKLAMGQSVGKPILYVHGAFFSAWTLFYFVQSLQVSRGRIRSHRAWGMAGISLATAMVISVVLAAINSIKSAEPLGMADQARQFSIVSLSGALLFSVIFGLAIANNARPESHKRLMLLVMIPLMHAALARVFKAFLAPDAIGPPPVEISVPPGIIACLLIGVAMIHDWRTRGRPHKVYLIGGPILLANILLAVPISQTPAWMAVARFVEGLAG